MKGFLVQGLLFSGGSEKSEVYLRRTVAWLPREAPWEPQDVPREAWGRALWFLSATILLDTLEHEKCPAKLNFPGDFHEISGLPWAPWELLGAPRWLLGSSGAFLGKPRDALWGPFSLPFCWTL